jgi:hypothetical protein
MSTYAQTKGLTILRVLVLFLVLLTTEGLAQTGKFQLRFVQDSVNCTTRKVVFSAQIRATSTDNQFVMGSASLVFQSTNAALTNPVLVSRDNFSGGRYSQLSLGQQAGTLTLNIVYQGTSPYTDVPNVTTDWKSIAHLSFDIPALSDGCYSLTWNTAQDFPSTDVFEVLIDGGTAEEELVMADGYTNATACAFAAGLPLATLSGDTTIASGQPAILRINFSGASPLSVAIAGTTYSNLTQPPLLVNVSPASTTTYSIDSVFNACGKGTVQGSATVTVQAPVITTQAVSEAIVCAGTSIQVPFTTSGTFGANNSFRVQLSDALGNNFTDIPTLGSVSPLTATLPQNTPAGTGYRVRVVSSNPVVAGEPSGTFTISTGPTAVLAGGATIPAGGTANLSVTLTGKPPWQVTLSDNTTQTTSVSPLLISVSPAATTTYSVLSVTGACGSGTATGTALITVQSVTAPCKTLCAPVSFRIIRQ